MRLHALTPAWSWLRVRTACSGDFMKVWDQVSMVLLGIVAILTPYEVAFMQLNLDFWFFFNRAIDIAFFFDMCLCVDTCGPRWCAVTRG